MLMANVLGGAAASLLHRSRTAALSHLVRMPPGRLSLEVFRGTSYWEETPGQTQEGLAGGIICPFWPGNAPGSPRWSFSSGPVASATPTSDKRKKNEWMAI